MKHNDTLNILLIHGNSSDEIKKELKNIHENIIKYDIFIYSPTIEAGLYIDLTNTFNKLFFILSYGSCSQSAFLQMTARIRKLNNNNITILNKCFNNNDISNSGILKRLNII